MILCIDTTSQEAGITLVGKKTYRAPMDPLNSSEQIFQKINTVMKQAKIEPSDLTGVFVIKGPGSFTGLRVGIAVANQFAHQLKIPIVGITTDEWWGHRAPAGMYMQTMNKDEIYTKDGLKTTETLKQVQSDTKWFGQISQNHREGLPKNFTEITNLLSPEETWEIVIRNSKPCLPAGRFVIGKKYDLVEPYYGKEAKITPRKNQA